MKGRIAQDMVEKAVGIHQPDVLLENGYATGKRTFRDILPRLDHRSLIHVNTHNGCIHDTLGSHERNEARTTANIQHALSLRKRSPSAKQDAIGTHRHRRTVVTNREVLEAEKGGRHADNLFLTQNYTF